MWQCPVQVLQHPQLPITPWEKALTKLKSTSTKSSLTSTKFTKTCWQQQNVFAKEDWVFSIEETCEHLEFFPTDRTVALLPTSYISVVMNKNKDNHSWKFLKAPTKENSFTQLLKGTYGAGKNQSNFSLNSLFSGSLTCMAFSDNILVLLINQTAVKTSSLSLVFSSLHLSNS